MKQDTLEYSKLVEENKLFHKQIYELQLENEWLKGMLYNFGVPITAGKRTILTITKGGKAV